MQENLKKISILSELSNKKECALIHIKKNKKLFMVCINFDYVIVTLKNGKKIRKKFSFPELISFGNEKIQFKFLPLSLSLLRLLFFFF